MNSLSFDFPGFDIEDKTPQGIDKLDLMIRFMPLVESKGNKTRKHYDRFKSFLCQQLQRGITIEEENGLCEGILKYINSDGGTPERLQAMDEVFNLKFIK